MFVSHNYFLWARQLTLLTTIRETMYAHDREANYQKARNEYITRKVLKIRNDTLAGHDITESTYLPVAQIREVFL